MSFAFGGAAEPPTYVGVMNVAYDAQAITDGRAVLKVNGMALELTFRKQGGRVIAKFLLTDRDGVLRAEGFIQQTPRP